MRELYFLDMVMITEVRELFVSFRTESGGPNAGPAFFIKDCLPTMKGWEHNWSDRVEELKKIKDMIETIVRFPLSNELFPVNSIELDATMEGYEDSS